MKTIGRSESHTGEKSINEIITSLENKEEISIFVKNLMKVVL